MKEKRIKTNPEVLKWLVSESRIEPNLIEERFPKITSWINYEEYPTFNQLKRLCNFLKVPFGHVFLEMPPTMNTFEVEFRTINNITNGRPSKELEDTIFEMEQKKEWMSDYRKELGWDPLDYLGSLLGNRNDTTDIIYQVLKIEKNWFLEIENTDKAFVFLREKMENVGVIVMVNGVVGENTHRKLEINEFRAFALVDDYAPLIFINRNDSKTGMIFSLVHEFFHLLKKTDDLLNTSDNVKSNTKDEQDINKLTARFLCPESYVIENMNPNVSETTNVIKLARELKISNLAVAIRLHDLGLVSEETVSIIRELTESDLAKKRQGSGGDYYLTKSSRLSSSFVEAVITQAESGHMFFTEAFRLLGLRGKTYDSFKENFGL